MELMKYNMEEAPEGGRFIPSGAHYPEAWKKILITWVRIVGNDGSTVAYVPDKMTGEKIISCLLS